MIHIPNQLSEPVRLSKVKLSILAQVDGQLRFVQLKLRLLWRDFREVILVWHRPKEVSNDGQQFHMSQ
jgi:hypothetical protein